MKIVKFQKKAFQIQASAAVMKITGHKTEKSFLKYIRVTKLDAAKRLSQHIKLRWNEKLLKVAQKLVEQ